jgi:hypothetical protein
MLDDTLDQEREHAVAARLECLQGDLRQTEELLATARAEAEGLANAVYAWSIEALSGRAEPDNQRDQMLLRAAEILGYEGMAQAAAERLAGQTVLL